MRIASIPCKVLIWEGVVKQRSFKNWKAGDDTASYKHFGMVSNAASFAVQVTHVRNEPEARKLLNVRGLEH